VGPGRSYLQGGFALRLDPYTATVPCYTFRPPAQQTRLVCNDDDDDDDDAFLGAVPGRLRPRRRRAPRSSPSSRSSSSPCLRRVSDSSEGFWIFGFKTFVIVSDDISASAARINVVLFVHITLSLSLSLYLLGFSIQVRLRRPALLTLAGIVPDAQSRQVLPVPLPAVLHPGAPQISQRAGRVHRGNGEQRHSAFIFGPPRVLATVPCSVSWSVAAFSALQAPSTSTFPTKTNQQAATAATTANVNASRARASREVTGP
jgi:hypothetical protein